jgi:hypothetical protein
VPIYEPQAKKETAQQQAGMCSLSLALVVAVMADYWLAAGGDN